MNREKRLRAGIRIEIMLLFLMAGVFLYKGVFRTEGWEQAVVTATSASGKDYIKWVDFTVSYEALCRAYDWDVDTFDTEHHVEWIPLLAYTAARTGGEFDKKALKILNEAAGKWDEEQKESDNEIWIDVYPLTRFLAKHTQEVHKIEGTKEWIRTTKIREF